MDTFADALLIALGVAMPLSAMFLLFRRGMRQLAVAGAYQDVARRYGLPADTHGVSLQGFLEDRRIWVGGVMVGHGPDRRTITWGVIDLQRPLALGLLIRRRGLSERVFRRSRAPEVPLADVELNRKLEIRADDPAAAKILLGPAVQEALRALTDGWPGVVVTDRTVRVQLDRPEATSERLYLLVEGMLRLARALEWARKDVSPPPRLAALLPEWAALADRRGLQVEGWLPGLMGQTDGRRVTIYAHRDDTGYNAEIRVWFRDHGELGLRVAPQRAGDVPGQDVQTGDPEFDPAFEVKSWDPDAARALLTDPVRRAFMALGRRGPLELDDRRFRVRSLPLDAPTLSATLDEMLLVAQTLGW